MTNVIFCCQPDANFVLQEFKVLQLKATDMDMEIVKLTKQNISHQHICCAFSDKKSFEGYQKKKKWLKSAFKDGYSFAKIDVRGKVFIEYVPIAHSWLPLDGSNFMVINCFWVSGQFKGKGYGKKLLGQCIEDAKEEGMDGIIAVSGERKRPFMSDPGFFKRRGMEIIDEAPPFFKLWGLKFNDNATYPKFKDTAKKGYCPDRKGIVAYYSNTCPFTEYYTNKQLREYAEKRGIPIKIHHIKSQNDGQKMPIPWIINSVFYNGDLITLDISATKHLDKAIQQVEEMAK